MRIGCDAYGCSLRSLTRRMRVCVAGASLFQVSGLLVVGHFEILPHRRAIHNRSKDATAVAVMMETVGAA